MARCSPCRESRRRSDVVYSPNVPPHYWNHQYDLYYPNRPTLPGVQQTGQCAMTPELLDGMLNADFTHILHNVDISQSPILKEIRKLDGKLNSPEYGFLRAYQPDSSCVCEETQRLGSQCPCPPTKQTMRFGLEERDLYGSGNVSQGEFQAPRSYSANKQERDTLVEQTKALDDALASPRMSFFSGTRQREDQRPPRKQSVNFQNNTDVKEEIPETNVVLTSVDNGLKGDCKNRNLVCQDLAKRKNKGKLAVLAEMARAKAQERLGIPSGSCFPGCPCCKRGSRQLEDSSPPRKPSVNFQNKADVQEKIRAIDDVLSSPQYGLKDDCKNRNLVCRDLAKRSRNAKGSCVSGCPPAKCRCGNSCPSMAGTFETFPERTFHVPCCPSDQMCMPFPRSPEHGVKTCPFSPACCPIGDVCPFPVSTIYDPDAPALPPLVGPRKCPRIPTSYEVATDDPSRPPCPLDPLKPMRAAPGCPLAANKTCQIGQQSGCPLLTCSLGELKSLVFDGNDECPFCGSKCCPMITPDGPGCPISMNSTFCPLGNTDACCLQGSEIPPDAAPVQQLTAEGEESCPVGELLAANAKKFSCAPQSSCYCAASSRTTTVKPSRPDSCPLANMPPPQPPAPPCPLSKVGGKNLDPSCPVSNFFECPALRREQNAHGLLKEKPKEIKSEEPKREHKDAKHNQGSSQTLVRQKQRPVEVSSATLTSERGKKEPSEAAIQKTPSAVTGKTEEIITKTLSTIYEQKPVHVRRKLRKLVGSTSRWSGIEHRKLSLEPLPRPPLSDTQLLKTAQAGCCQSRASPEREDAAMVRASAPSDSKGFEPTTGKQKPRNCPFPEPKPCPLELPKCPFGPPEPSCPLAKTVECPLQQGPGCCKSGLALKSQNLVCPVETPPCNIFPQGHCPMEDLKVCECDYPIAPCMEPLIPEEDALAGDQFCAKLNCCMGLPLPPTKPSPQFETDTWYAFTDIMPGHPATKHYLEILNYPPEPKFFVSINEARKHPAWKIIRYGEGYQQCKKVKELLNKRGPCSTVATQFCEDDMSEDEEIQIIEQNKRDSAKMIQTIIQSTLQRPEWNCTD